MYHAYVGNPYSLGMLCHRRLLGSAVLRGRVGQVVWAQCWAVRSVDEVHLVATTLMVLRSWFYDVSWVSYTMIAYGLNMADCADFSGG